LKDIVEYVLTELQRTCLDAQDIAQTRLQDWLKGVVSNLHEVKVLKTWVKTPLCLRERNLLTSFHQVYTHESLIWIS